MGEAALGSLLATAADLVVAAALLLAIGVVAATRSLRAALPVLLDLLLAAGLLRLASAGSWRAVGTAAAVVLIRKLATAGVGHRPDRPPTDVDGRSLTAPIRSRPSSRPGPA